MAPEVLMGDFSYKCDIWSLGCMIFAVYNSQPLLGRASTRGARRQHFPFGTSSVN